MLLNDLSHVADVGGIVKSKDSNYDENARIHVLACLLLKGVLQSGSLSCSI